MSNQAGFLYLARYSWSDHQRPEHWDKAVLKTYNLQTLHLNSWPCLLCAPTLLYFTIQCACESRWERDGQQESACSAHAPQQAWMRVSSSNSSLELTSWQGKQIPPTFWMYTPAVNQSSDRGKMGEDSSPSHYMSSHRCCIGHGIYETHVILLQVKLKTWLKAGSRTPLELGAVQNHHREGCSPVWLFSHLHTILSTGWIWPIGEAIWTAGVHQIMTLKCNRTLYLTLREAAVRSWFPTSKTSQNST